MKDSNHEVVPQVAVTPIKALALLSHAEVNDLCATRGGRRYELFRRCSLAVMTSGVETDNARELLELYRGFDIRFEQVDNGIRLHVFNAPARAFVDGVMIRGVQEQLFAVLRDIVYIARDIEQDGRIDPTTPAGITDIVFHILRNAGLLLPNIDSGLVVCWGGHAIGPVEYDYCKEVGYELGLRGLDICTGCGAGAMKGPMKGATIAHAKQRIRNGRYIGVTEPGIIAAEAPNPIVNALVILPDIEKRLEAFVRLGHGVIVFPGGVGTAEEILYLLGILSHPDNAEIPLPVIFTGPPSSAAYFAGIDEFIKTTTGARFSDRYEIIVGDAARVASRMREHINEVLKFRDDNDDAAYFNWLLRVDADLQTPFAPSHEAMAAQVLQRDLPRHRLIANLRRVLSGIVNGNVKEEGIRAVESNGPYEIRGEREIVAALDRLLRSFVAQERMRLPGREYTPCYRLAM